MVVPPLQGKYLRRSQDENGYAARAAEKWKISHYKEAMAQKKPDEKFIPIAIEAFARIGQMAREFLRDGCKHLLHRREELSDLRTQRNRRLWQRNAEIALGALRVDQLDNPLVHIFL
uniref:Uncharacterized protein n=1 Tax=Rhodosorus marinus TaxID=101924 RepID=A0A7S2ZBG9_9RHOD|mmetsp:Transcript_13437/g.53930  ORF Transcript_13437/g.53930 Transcript_13437/m.53930 type:complete len:117 (+) Transcript_13437:275-625(+)